ncbi:membrane protein [Streptomyces canarius]
MQLVLPATALLVICCTFLGAWAVLAAGLVSAVSVAVGVVLTARASGRERAASATAAAG